MSKKYFILIAMMSTIFDFANASVTNYNCANPQTQAEMNYCAQQDYAKADAALNKLYKEALLKYKNNDKELLVNAERKWIAYRDAECAFETAQSVNGSVHPMVYTGCLTYYTNIRVKDLTNQINCEEGDMSCNSGD